MLRALMYISESNLGESRPNDHVASILKASNANNPMRGVTGALVFTGKHFVQALEGERSSLDGLMSTLATDPRHCDVMVVQDGPLSTRRFADWSMAYVGPSIFVSRHVRRLLADPSASETKRAVDWLETLLVDTARTTVTG